MKNITSLTKEIYIEIAHYTVFMSYNNKSYFCGNLYLEDIYMPVGIKSSLIRTIVTLF